MYVRVLLQCLIFEGLRLVGPKSAKRLVFDDLAETVLPADQILDERNDEIEVPHDPRFQITRCMNAFVTRACHVSCALTPLLQAKLIGKFRSTLTYTAASARTGPGFVGYYVTVSRSGRTFRLTYVTNFINTESFNIQKLQVEEIDDELRKYTNEEPVVVEGEVGVLEDMYAYPLSSWAYHHKLRQMEWIIQLGFELEIYQPDELSGMYW